jgi:hypothetical protein
MWNLSRQRETKKKKSHLPHKFTGVCVDERERCAHAQNNFFKKF